MRIIIKGYHYGENTPPHFIQYRKLGCEVKLLCMNKYSWKSLIREHELPPFLTKDDILIPEFNKFQELFIRLSKKANFYLGRMLHIQKTKKLITAFRPDIVVHHSLNYHSYICHKAYNTIHVGIPYSSDGYIRSKNTKNLRFYKYIFKNFDAFIFVLPVLKDFYTKVGVDNKKSIVLRMGISNLSEIKSIQQSDGLRVRITNKLSQSDFVFIETRSLRQIDGGAFQLIEAFSEINKYKTNCYLVIMKGLLGKDGVLSKLRQFIYTNYNKLMDRIIIIDKELNYIDYLAHIVAADVYISLLKNDQFGKSISEAIILNNQLILSDLPQYRHALKDGAFYINPESPNSIFQAMLKTINLTNEEKNDRTSRLNRWVEEADFESNARKRIAFYSNLVKKA
ncbi:MAG TPA: hypothetical protein ENO27_02095 [Caldithrix sp.]|nr:hypothetical protein [Caldithrix sp.]